jgi:hypothetical protein
MPFDSTSQSKKILRSLIGPETGTNPIFKTKIELIIAKLRLFI